MGVNPIKLKNIFARLYVSEAEMKAQLNTFKHGGKRIVSIFVVLSNSSLTVYPVIDLTFKD